LPALLPTATTGAESLVSPSSANQPTICCCSAYSLSGMRERSAAAAAANARSLIR
jgi:hypothetical protein